MLIYAFKRKNFEKMLCLQPWRYLFISLHLHLHLCICKLPLIQWISLETNILPLISQMLPILGYPGYFDYQEFVSFASHFSFQSFHAGKL